MYDTLPHVGSRLSRQLLRTAATCAFVVIAASCGEDEAAGPGPTELPTVEPTPEEPSPTEPPTAQPTPTEDGGMSQSPEPAPELLTDADDGRVVSLALGTETPLQLDSAWFWDEPAVQGDAIMLTRVDYLTDPGFMEWIITAQHPGDAVLTATGEPNCDDVAQCPPRSIRIRFHVTG